MIPLLPLLPWAAAGIAGIAATGYTADKIGEGVDDAGSGLVKTAVAAAVAYYLFKKVSK